MERCQWLSTNFFVFHYSYNTNLRLKFSYDIPIVNFYSTRGKNGLFRNVKTFLGAKEEPVKFSERPVTIGLEV